MLTWLMIHVHNYFVLDPESPRPNNIMKRQLCGSFRNVLSCGCLLSFLINSDATFEKCNSPSIKEERGTQNRAGEFVSDQGWSLCWLSLVVSLIIRDVWVWLRRPWIGLPSASVTGWGCFSLRVFFFFCDGLSRNLRCLEPKLSLQLTLGSV